METREPLLPNSQTKKTTKTACYAKANLLSLLTFTWLNPLLKFGYKTSVTLDDVPNLPPRDTAIRSYTTFQRRISKLKSSSTAPLKGTSLAKAIFFSIWLEWSVNAVFALAYTISSFVGPYLMNPLMQHLEGEQESGYGFLASVFIGAKLIESFAHPLWFFGSYKLSLQIRAALTAAIYEKGLRLSTVSKQRQTSGEIINLASIDVHTIGEFAWFWHEIWLLPIQVLLALFILYRNLGVASIAVVAATVALAIAHQPLAMLQKKFQSNIMEAKDERMKATSEALRNMRILKFYAWESKYMERLVGMRSNECGWLWKYLFAKAVVIFMFWIVPIVISSVTFCISVVSGVSLTTAKVLATLATLKVLQEPMKILPEAVSVVVRTKVSLDRIAKFLEMEELQPSAVERVEISSNGTIIDIEGGQFTWDPSSLDSSLSVMKLQVQTGMKVAICGPVGSGKSSILSCILGEMRKISGVVKVSGCIAYVSQSSWIQSGTVQDNIWFGKPMDEVKYHAVVGACALDKDLEMFSHGDQTQIGERGINLSGGQKQRIQLARAVYQDADIYLLDDPFSAVDAHTGTHLFKECLQGILSSKTILYVTHQVDFLPLADLILVMRDGMITQAGLYNNLLREGMDFLRLIGSHDQALEVIHASKHQSILTSRGTEQLNALASEEKMEHKQYCKPASTLKKQNSLQDIGNKGIKGADDPEFKKEHIVQDEEKQTGRVSFQIYWCYLTSVYKGLPVIVILLAHVLFQTLAICSNYWMASATPTSMFDKQVVSSSRLVLVYISLAVGSSFCALLRSLVLAQTALSSAQIYFMRMLGSIFHAPMAFFDATPTGRILNRVTTDQTDMDRTLPLKLGSLAFSVIDLLGIITVMSQVAWEVFALSVLVLVIIIWYQQYYIATARELARLIGVRKAPIINHFAESISGASIIRAFDQENRFMLTNLSFLDDYSRVRFHSSASQEWLTLRLNLLSNFIFSSCLVFLLSLPRGTVDPSIAGLAVTYGLNLTALQFMVIYDLCDVENRMISVERILQYCKIPSEAPLVIDESQPHCEWPSSGTIDFENLQVRYREHLPLILRGITCRFPGGKKVGIVGRTGSGKSTLIQAIFRILEPAQGRITIDGVDITKIGLHDLRSKLSIIPQDPTMFEGSIRGNLDPLEEHSDTEIWEALRKCQLERVVHSKECKLNAKVSENGENWSMGQRQLMCLGRVLLKKNRILVLDEATASVDTEMDLLIHNTIRKEYGEGTVITIAHRIFTIMDADLVLVLSDGRIVEFDSPSQLLQQSSFFAKLVAEYMGRSSCISKMG